jgi:hypothetical protein
MSSLGFESEPGPGGPERSTMLGNDCSQRMLLTRPDFNNIFYDESSSLAAAKVARNL